MKRTPLFPVEVYRDADAIGEVLARDILRGIAAAARKKRAYLLGCPGGRSLQTTYRALGKMASREGADLSHLILVMMDDYALKDGVGWVYPPANAHFSCRRFGRRDILGVLNHGLPMKRRVPRENLWLPDPVDPAEYDHRLRAAGKVDLFLLASGTTDGHVAFNPPGSRADSPSRLIRIADATRRDNLSTFPRFRSLSEVPRHGVSVGLGSISRLSKSVALVIHGTNKRSSVRKLLSLRDFSASWPVSIVFRCSRARILLDCAAAGSCANCSC
jgi:glucosamine-6-phosphate deaminase